jgi:hypothetical protein
MPRVSLGEPVKNASGLTSVAISPGMNGQLYHRIMASQSVPPYQHVPVNLYRLRAALI